MVNFDGLLIGSALFYKYWYRVKPSTVNIPFFLICLQLKLISSLYGLRFGWTNRFTVSGNPISVSLSFFMSLSSIFFANFFEKKFLWAKRIIVLNELPRWWHALISDLWILMTIFPQNLYTFILQLPPFHTKWDTVNNGIITTKGLVLIASISPLSDSMALLHFHSF